MEITVNKKAISTLLNDELSINEIIDFLNEIIDNEIEKEIPDCDLIDDCINAIDDIQNQSNIKPFVRLVLTKNQVMKYCRRHGKNNNTIKAIVAACLIMVISGATVLNASPALAENVKSFFETVISTLQDISARTESEDYGNISSIYASYLEGSNLIVNSIDDIDETKFNVTAVYSDSTTKSIPISECAISKTLEHTDKGSYVLVAISYNGCACSIAFEVRG
ncbi:MAG: hypothetical protein ACI4RR_07870 [Eubacterium sp.]